MPAFPQFPYVSVNRRRLTGATAVVVGMEPEIELVRPSRMVSIGPPRLTLSVDLCDYAALDVLYRLDFKRSVRVEVRRPTGQMGWVFPEDPFITYEPRDEAWCRPLGIGHAGPTFAPPIVIERGFIFPSLDGFEVRDARPRIEGEMIARFSLPD